MKKSRPAVTLSALSEPGKKSAIIDIIMEETTTFGVRTTEYSRSKLARAFKEIETPGGRVRVKVGHRDGKILKAVPEYEDVKLAAGRSSMPLRDIIKAGRERRPRKYRRRAGYKTFKGEAWAKAGPEAAVLRSLRLAMAQINCTVGDLEGNLKKITSYIGRAKEEGADVVAFPELAVTGGDLLQVSFKVADGAVYLRHRQSQASQNGCLRPWPRPLPF